MPSFVLFESSSVILGEKATKILEPSESLYLVRVGRVLGARGRGWEGQFRTGRGGGARCRGLPVLRVRRLEKGNDLEDEVRGTGRGG